MLELIRERSKGWLAKAILALITVPFALFGIDAYLRDAGSSAPIAKVNGEAISVQEYSNAMQSLRNRLQAQGEKDLSILESPEIKESQLNRLIATRLVNSEVRNAKFRISDEQLSKYILGLPEFQENGQFSQQQYDSLLKQNQLSPSKFESSIRSDLLAQQAREGLATLAYFPQSITEKSLKAEHQQREVSVAEIKTADFISQVKIDPSQVKAYYETNKDKFRVPEQVKLEFVLMSANSLIMGMQVSEDDVKKYYAENASKFQGNEQRRASHILIGFGVSATPQAKLDAKKKAEDVLAEVKKNPAKFAELAKKYSQDPGSAEKGGDLGLFGRGTMVKSFDEAVFNMTPGAISDLVESEFGYHIIKLTEISGQAQGYDAVKPQIRAELMYQKSLAKFSEQAENFSNMVYEQSSSLKPAADAFGLQVQKTDWLSRADGAKFFKNDKLMNLVFTDEVLKDKRNTEAVEVSNSSLVSARIVDYKPAAPRTFDEVKAGIEDYLKLEAAAKLASQKGEATLVTLRDGKAATALEWIPSVVVTRKDAQGLTDLAMSQVFKIDTSKLPAYAGIADSRKGYLLVKVTRVDDTLATDDSAKKAAELELQQALSTEYAAAYISSLKDKAKITVNKQLLGTSSTNQ
ncbi:MAG TPA: SurA N-terminal domain-containing protein [Methylophilaceae bacterium]|nr:SurA N-terminal domain-containing protein [Methylophilaceae bacterium]